MLWIVKGCGQYEWLKILWAQAFRCYEQLKVVDDMNDSYSWAHDFKCNEQFRVVDDINGSR